MAVKTGKNRRAGLAALTLGAAILALPGAALAQQDDHHGDGRNAPREQQAPRPAPAPPPRAAPAPPVPMQRGGNWRVVNPGQPQSAPGNPGGNGWQHPPRQNYAPGQGQPANRDQPQYRGQPGYQGQQRGEGGYRNDAGPRNDSGARNDGRPRNDGGQWRNDGGFERGNDGGNWHNHDGGNWRGRDGQGPGAPGYGRPQPGREWNHGWRQDNRYDWRGYRAANREEFHVGRYYAPYRGYNYNRLGVGFYLQPLFFGSDYWISDPWYYRLPPAYGPYHWVRYYNDVVLVNTYNGQVADVIYDFFW